MCKSCHNLKQARPRSSKTSKPGGPSRKPTKADKARAFLKKAVATWDAKWLSRMLLDDDCRDLMSVPHTWDRAPTTLLHFACQMIFEQCIRTQKTTPNANAAQIAVLECLAASMPGMSQHLDHEGHLAADLIPRTLHSSRHFKSLRSCISGPVLWQAKYHGIVPPHIRVSARTVQRLWSAHGLDPDLLQPILQSGLVVGLGPDHGWVLGEILEMVGLSHFSKAQRLQAGKQVASMLRVNHHLTRKARVLKPDCEPFFALVYNDLQMTKIKEWLKIRYAEEMHLDASLHSMLRDLSF